MMGSHPQDPADWFRTLTPEQQSKLMRSAGRPGSTRSAILAAAAPIYVAAPAHQLIEEVQRHVYRVVGGSS